MIEVERNFDLREGEKEKLIEGAKFLGKKEFTDVYFDTKDLKLSLKDFWLRTRDGKWELKVPLNKDKMAVDRKTDQYREIEDDKQIALELKLNPDDLTISLRDNGYEPIATIKTARESYQNGEFHLDFDETNFEYDTSEVELLVNDISEIPMAEQKIMNFAETFGLSKEKGRGKLTVYLERFKPEIFELLVKAGIIKPVIL
jgi:predicted adenylyl cyclase CyaB